MKIKNRKKNMHKAFWNKDRKLEFHIPVTLEEVMEFNINKKIQFYKDNHLPVPEL